MSLLGKLMNKAKDAIASLINEDEFEACIAACVMIAAADGTIDDSEKETAIKEITEHEILKSFDKNKIRAKFDSDAKLVNSDKELAWQVLEKRVRKITDIEARIRILGIAKQIAAADGVFSKEEQSVVDRIRKITA